MLFESKLDGQLRTPLLLSVSTGYMGPWQKGGGGSTLHSSKFELVLSGGGGGKGKNKIGYKSSQANDKKYI